MNSSLERRNLYPYQVEDIERLKAIMSQHGFAMLFSEMGVGKTVECLFTCEDMLEENANDARVLIICSKTATFVWETEIRRWLNRPSVNLSRRYVGGRDFIDFGTPHNGGVRYMICTYDATYNEQKYDIMRVANLFDIIIVDEAHALRNMGTKRSHSIRSIVPKTGRILVTGTPIVNSLLDIYALFRVASNMASDRIRRTIGHNPLDNARYGTSRKVAATIAEATRDYSVFRTLEEAELHLPPISMYDIRVILSPRHYAIYREMMQLFRISLSDGSTSTAFDALTQLTRLRQIAIDPSIIEAKFDETSAKISEAIRIIEANEKIVLFSSFQQVIDRISPELDARHIAHVSISGRINQNKREKAINDFQDDPNVRVCLVTTKTGGEAITLTAADTIVFTDLWWTHSANNQAISRVRRIGQKNPINVYNIIAEKTIDEHISNIVRRKRDVGDVYQEALRFLELDERDNRAYIQGILMQ